MDRKQRDFREILRLRGSAGQRCVISEPAIFNACAGKLQSAGAGWPCGVCLSLSGLRSICPGLCGASWIAW